MTHAAAPFASRLTVWQARHGRHDLPWQKTADPYRVWLSEVMLQQTRVSTVIDYYTRFLHRFPDLPTLAGAPVGAVMELWSGLGYYARARHLHACARLLLENHKGRFPQDPAEIARLPGIGRSTANAIAAFCFGAHVPILDGNVKRLLCRHRGIEGYPGAPAVERRLWRDAEALLPTSGVATYIQAQMDMGATVCTRTRPCCTICPVAEDCIARHTGRIDALPTPRPRRERPERDVTLLVLQHGEQILLEQRPPAGIWGGLLSLPELPIGAHAENYCAHRLGVRIAAHRPLPMFTHDFTHFRLRLYPLLCAAEPLAVMEPALCWTKRDALASAPLPAPIRKLFSEIL